MSDAIFLLFYLFLGEVTPPCLAACDFDGDGQVASGLTDVLAILRYSYLGGSPPPPPFPGCSADFDGAVGCAARSSCP